MADTDSLTKSFVDTRQDAILDMHALTLRKLTDNRGAMSVLTGGAAAAMLISTKPNFVRDSDDMTGLDMHRIAGFALAAAGGSYLLGSFMSEQ